MIINNKLVFIGERYSNSKTWGHIAKAVYNGEVIATAKIRYYNRTWERYTFESVFYKLIDILDDNKNIPLCDRIEAYRKIKA